MYFAGSTVALIAPVYTWLGNMIEPRVLGLPWSLTYVLLVVLANSFVLAVLYVGRWVDDAESPAPAVSLGPDAGPPELSAGGVGGVGQP